MAARVPMPGRGVPGGAYGPWGEGGMPRNFNLDPMLPVIRRVLTQMDLIRPLKTVMDSLDSGPLVNICMASLKSVPYVFYADNRLVGHFDNAISCRMRYLEAAAMATASLVYNVVFGTVFTVASLVTLGQVREFWGQMRKHWIHTALAAASSVIGVVGTASPGWGLKANVGGLLATGLAIVQLAQGGAVERVASAWQHNAQGFKDVVLTGLEGDRAYFNEHFVPLFNYLDQNLTPNVRSFADLAQVVRGAVSLVPRVVPGVTREAVRDNLERIVSEWSGEAPATT